MHGCRVEAATHLFGTGGSRENYFASSARYVLTVRPSHPTVMRPSPQPTLKSSRPAPCVTSSSTTAIWQERVGRDRFRARLLQARRRRLLAHPRSSATRTLLTHAHTHSYADETMYRASPAPTSRSSSSPPSILPCSSPSDPPSSSTARTRGGSAPERRV